MKKLVWVIIISMNLVMGIAALIPWIYCKPMSAAWNFLEQGPGICWSFEITVIYNTFATGTSQLSVECSLVDESI
jgi:hypothetical protein